MTEHRPHAKIADAYLATGGTMRTWIALLRGINVSGQKRVPMADLRDALETAGLEAVRTYIQSGNVVFRADDESPVVERRVSAAIEARFGFHVDLLLLSLKRLVEIRDADPYSLETVAKATGVAFLSAAPAPQAVADLVAGDYGGDEVTVVGDAAYLRLLHGFGTTKLNLGFIERRLGVTATARNWRTVGALIELARDHSAG